MKKVFALLTVTGMLSFGTINSVYAQDAEEVATEETMSPDSAAQAEEAAAAAAAEEEEKAAAEAAAQEEVAPVPEDKSFTQVIKQKFIGGGPGFMGIVLVCLILGLALVIERIIYLNMATTNSNKLLKNIESALSSGGVEASKEQTQCFSIIYWSW
jgi:biopolymer transport protein ExbB